jgi:hypothetical protein
MSQGRWTAEQANEWFTRQPWLVGCNFIPSTAINQLEMWQAPTFDPETIERELGWASAIGFNSVRVFLHDLVWQSDPDGFKQRIDRFLDIASRKGIRPMFVFFDDCWNNKPQPGKQPEPAPGVHNSGWVQSPGEKIVTQPGSWSRLESYIKGVLEAFANDEQILMWDLYNEPGNKGLGEKSLDLLRATFEWALAIRPHQPLTAGIWADYPNLNEFQIEASDIITFHHYADVPSLLEWIQRFKAYGRPVICTEYMARTRGSRFTTHLPVFKQEQVGCYNWGLVRGKTQTIYPWESPEGAPEPETWFHDIFHQDGTPYDRAEVAAIMQLGGKDRDEPVSLSFRNEEG